MANVVADNIGEARENVTGWWNRSRTFLTEVRNELKRVTWPPKKSMRHDHGDPVLGLFSASFCGYSPFALTERCCPGFQRKAQGRQ
jgi:hypothetical protein